MMKASLISNQMFIRVYSSRLLWYQIDVLRCNSILSESCLVSSNKLAWLSPDPGLWYGALSSGNEIINIIARTRDSSLRKSYLYCKIGSHENIGRRSWRTTWLTRNNLQQMVNSFNFYGLQIMTRVSSESQLYPRLGLITNKPHGQRLTTNYFLQTNIRAAIAVLLYYWV